jgi:hypothetical protein
LIALFSETFFPAKLTYLGIEGMESGLETKEERELREKEKLEKQKIEKEKRKFGKNMECMIQMVALAPQLAKRVIKRSL